VVAIRKKQSDDRIHGTEDAPTPMQSVVPEFREWSVECPGEAGILAGLVLGSLFFCKLLTCGVHKCVVDYGA
jgi:hypothetical protein